MSTEKTTVQGSCLCMRVRFQVTLPSKFVAHCHCAICRRAHAAPFVTWLGTWEDNLEVSEGRDRLVAFESSPGGRRQFCGSCGAHLFFRADRWPGEVHVSRAAIRDEVDRAPQAHVFYSDRASWVDVDGDAQLPRLGGPSGVEPLEEESD